MDGVVGRGTVLAGRYQLRDPRPCDLPGAADWSAVDQILARPVLVRVFPAAGSAPALDAARRAALVSDPRLQRVLDVGTHEDVGYVVTEQVSGPSLAQLVSREPLSADQARAVVGEAAAALEAARRRGVHHLALRPGSIAVSDDGRVLLSGLALDATLLGNGGDARTTSRTDAAGLVRLVYTALTGHWPGPIATSDGLPTAPEVDGAPVAPSELARRVPPDLDTLCRVTLGRDDDGPHSPAEVVRELEPWGEIRVSRPAAPPIPLPLPDDAVTGPVTPPGQVTRQSVRSAFSSPTPAVNRPGTPPAAPPWGAPTPAAGTPPVTPPTVPVMPPLVPPPTAPLPPPPVAALPPTVPPPGAVGPGPGLPVPPAGRDAPPSFPAEPPEDDPFDFGVAEDDEPPRRTGTVVAIVVVGLLVVVGIGFGIRTLVSGLGGGGEPAAGGATTSGSTPSATGATTASTPTPTPTETTPTAPPVVTGITSIDPSDTDGEHEEAVGRAIDGDPGTYWFSQTYNRDDFSGIKPGVGLALTLAEPATVGTVTLHVNGTGGHVEVRATDAANPTAGPVLASGALGPDTVLTLDPAPTTSSIVVWFTQLSTNPAGQFRIELTELTLG